MGQRKKNTVCFLYFVQYFILFLEQIFGVSKNNFSHWKQYALVFNKYKASITKLNMLYSATLDLCIKKKRFLHSYLNLRQVFMKFIGVDFT